MTSVAESKAREHLEAFAEGKGGVVRIDGLPKSHKKSRGERGKKRFEDKATEEAFKYQMKKFDDQFLTSKKLTAISLRVQQALAKYEGETEGGDEADLALRKQLVLNCKGKLKVILGENDKVRTEQIDTLDTISKWMVAYADELGQATLAEEENMDDDDDINETCQGVEDLIDMQHDHKERMESVSDMLMKKMKLVVDLAEEAQMERQDEEDDSTLHSSFSLPHASDDVDRFEQMNVAARRIAEAKASVGQMTTKLNFVKTQAKAKFGNKDEEIEFLRSEVDRLTFLSNELKQVVSGTDSGNAVSALSDMQSVVSKQESKIVKLQRQVEHMTKQLEQKSAEIAKVASGGASTSVILPQQLVELEDDVSHIKIEMAKQQIDFECVTGSLIAENKGKMVPTNEMGKRVMALQKMLMKYTEDAKELQPWLDSLHDSFTKNITALSEYAPWDPKRSPEKRLTAMLAHANTREGLTELLKNQETSVQDAVSYIETTRENPGTKLWMVKLIREFGAEDDQEILEEEDEQKLVNAIKKRMLEIIRECVAAKASAASQLLAMPEERSRTRGSRAASITSARAAAAATAETQQTLSPTQGPPSTAGGRGERVKPGYKQITVEEFEKLQLELEGLRLQCEQLDEADKMLRKYELQMANTAEHTMGAIKRWNQVTRRVKDEPSLQQAKKDIQSDTGHVVDAIAQLQEIETLPPPVMTALLDSLEARKEDLINLQLAILPVEKEAVLQRRKLKEDIAKLEEEKKQLLLQHAPKSRAASPAQGTAPPQQPVSGKAPPAGKKKGGALSKGNTKGGKASKKKQAIVDEEVSSEAAVVEEPRVIKKANTKIDTALKKLESLATASLVEFETAEKEFQESCKTVTEGYNSFYEHHMAVKKESVKNSLKILTLKQQIDSINAQLTSVESANAALIDQVKALEKKGEGKTKIVMPAGTSSQDKEFIKRVQENFEKERDEMRDELIELRAKNLQRKSLDEQAAELLAMERETSQRLSEELSEAKMALESAATGNQDAINDELAKTQAMAQQVKDMEIQVFETQQTMAQLIQDEEDYKLGMQYTMKQLQMELKEAREAANGIAEDVLAPDIMPAQIPDDTPEADADKLNREYRLRQQEVTDATQALETSMRALHAVEAKLKRLMFDVPDTIETQGKARHLTPMITNLSRHGSTHSAVSGVSSPGRGHRGSQPASPKSGRLSPSAMGASPAHTPRRDGDSPGRGGGGGGGGSAEASSVRQGSSGRPSRGSAGRQRSTASSASTHTHDEGSEEKSDSEASERDVGDGEQHGEQAGGREVQLVQSGEGSGGGGLDFRKAGFVRQKSMLRPKGSAGGLEELPAEEDERLGSANSLEDGDLPPGMIKKRVFQSSLPQNFALIEADENMAEEDEAEDEDRDAVFMTALPADEARSLEEDIEDVLWSFEKRMEEAIALISKSSLDADMRDTIKQLCENLWVGLHAVEELKLYPPAGVNVPPAAMATENYMVAGAIQVAILTLVETLIDVALAARMHTPNDPHLRKDWYKAERIAMANLQDQYKDLHSIKVSMEYMAQQEMRHLLKCNDALAALSGTDPVAKALRRLAARHRMALDKWKRRRDTLLADRKRNVELMIAGFASVVSAKYIFRFNSRLDSEITTASGMHPSDSLIKAYVVERPPLSPHRQTLPYNNGMHRHGVPANVVLDPNAQLDAGPQLSLPPPRPSLSLENFATMSVNATSSVFDGDQTMPRAKSKTGGRRCKGSPTKMFLPPIDKKKMVAAQRSTPDLSIGILPSRSTTAASFDSAAWQRSKTPPPRSASTPPFVSAHSRSQSFAEHRRSPSPPRQSTPT